GSPPVKKNLVLRAPGGPDQTILWMSDQPEDPRRGCVVIFQKGEGPGTVLEGFTIAGGRGTDVGGFPVGGGVLCLGSSPTLRNLAVTENEGGVYVRGGAPVLSDSLIAYNLLSGISAGEGSSLTIERCTVRGHSYGERGGIGIFGSTVTVDDSRIVANMTSREDCGGGIGVFDSTLRLSRSIVAGNRGDGGGGICAMGSKIEMVNCLFVANTSGQGGGAIRLYPDCELSADQCTFYSN